MPDVVNTSLDQQLTCTTTTAATTTTSSSCVSELVFDESDGSESATPDMDSQLLYVRLKEVTTTTTTTTTPFVSGTAAARHYTVSQKTMQTYFLSELRQISTDCENFWHKDSEEDKIF